MSRHQEWKMIHLLYQYARRTGRSARRVLTEEELRKAGVHCDPDSRQVLEDAGVVKRIGNAYELTKAARKIVSTFTLAKGCLLYTSDAADERSSVDLGGRRIIKK